MAASPIRGGGGTAAPLAVAGVPLRLGGIGGSTALAAPDSSSPLELAAVYYRKRPRDGGPAAAPLIDLMGEPAAPPAPLAGPVPTATTRIVPVASSTTVSPARSPDASGAMAAGRADDGFPAPPKRPRHDTSPATAGPPGAPPAPALAPPASDAAVNTGALLRELAAPLPAADLDTTVVDDEQAPPAQQPLPEPGYDTQATLEDADPTPVSVAASQPLNLSLWRDVVPGARTSTAATTPAAGTAAGGSRPRPVLEPPVPPPPAVASSPSAASTGESDVVPPSQPMDDGSHAPISQFSDMFSDLLSNLSIRHYVTSLDPDEVCEAWSLAPADRRRPLRVTFRAAVRVRSAAQAIVVTDIQTGRVVAGQVRTERAPAVSDVASVVVFEPHEPWQASHHYEVLLNPSAVSVRGAALKQYRWTFKVEHRPG